VRERERRREWGWREREREEIDRREKGEGSRVGGLWREKKRKRGRERYKKG
jgi:hypothetical protein